MSMIDNGHLTIEEWRRYIQNEMTTSERERADRELLVCEGCMWLFMEAMEEAERSESSSLPTLELPDMAQLEERVISELRNGAPVREVIESSNEPMEASDRKPKIQAITMNAHQPKRRGSWLQHPVTHYTLAASITLLLIATGALTGFSEKLQQLEHLEPEAQTVSAEWTEGPSWSDRLVDRAGSFLDGVQAWRFK